MATITIEWQHLDVGGETCERCKNTGQELRQAIDGLRTECAAKGVKIRFRETLLAPGQIGQSNAILINGVPLETALPHAEASTSCCASCGDLTGRDEQCRTLVHLGQIHETIPGELIRQAVCRIGGCC